MKRVLHRHREWRSASLAATLFLSLILLLSGVSASKYCKLSKQPAVSVTPPPVALQAGTAGNSTIYTNSTSAQVNVSTTATDIQYNESEAESTTSSTSWQDKVVLAWNVPSAPDYLILATADVSTTGTSGGYQAEAQITIDGTAYSLHKILSGAANDYLSFFSAKKVNLAGGSHTLKIQYRSASTSSTAKIRNAHLLAWSEMIQYAEDDSESATTSKTFQNKTTLAFAPSAQADYLVIGTAVIAGFGMVSTPVEADLTIDGTEYGYSLINPVSTKAYNYYSFGVIKKISLSTASHNIIIRWRTPSGAIAYIKDARIVASQLGTNYYSEDESETSTTSSTPVDKVVNTYTPSAGDYLTLGNVQTRHNKTSSIGHSNFNLSATEYHHIFFTPTNSSNCFASVFMKKRTLTSTLTTDKIQHWVTADPQFSQRARLISLQLTSPSTYDHVLKISNQVADNWNVNLKVYDSSNTNRLSGTTISFHDGTSSDQIIVSNGNITQSEGALYNLPAGVGSTVYISMGNLQTSAAGTSYLYVYLRILVPGKTTYSLYVITFDIA